MKRKSVGRHLLFSLVGIIVLVIGALLAKHLRNERGIMQVLAYTLIGIGASIFATNLGIVFNIFAMKKSRKITKND